MSSLIITAISALVFYRSLSAIELVIKVRKANLKYHAKSEYLSQPIPTIEQIECESEVMLPKVYKMIFSYKRLTADNWLSESNYKSLKKYL